MEPKDRREVYDCPFDTGIQLISGRWKPRILWKLSQRTMRFGELRRDLPGITEKVLTQQLRELEQDELVVRTLYPVVPPKVEYSLTDLGKSLSPVLQQFADWGEANRSRIAGILRKP